MTDEEIAILRTYDPKKWAVEVQKLYDLENGVKAAAPQVALPHVPQVSSYSAAERRQDQNALLKAVAVGLGKLFIRPVLKRLNDLEARQAELASASAVGELADRVAALERKLSGG